MSEDTCGHPTEGGDGPPCELPASKADGRCHHHTDTDERANGGREWSIDESDHETILSAARDGFSKAGCARAAGVDEKILRRYLDAHDDFRRAFMRARHDGERTLLKGPLVEREDERESIDGQHARFLLSTSFDYQKTEKRELEDVTEGEGGFGTNIIVSGEYDPEDGDD
jgi:hypothetical protein